MSSKEPLLTLAAERALSFQATGDIGAMVAMELPVEQQDLVLRSADISLRVRGSEDGPHSRNGHLHRFLGSNATSNNIVVAERILETAPESGGLHDKRQSIPSGFFLA